MKIHPSDTYEAKKKKLALVPPDRKFTVMDALSRGEVVDVTTAQDVRNDPFIPALTELLKNRTIDLTKHADLYYIVNRKVIPLRQMLSRRCWDPYRKHAETIRKLNAGNNGFTDGKTLRHIAAFPPEVYNAIVDQYSDLKERELVINWLLKTDEGKPFSTVDGGF